MMHPDPDFIEKALRPTTKLFYPQPDFQTLQLAEKPCRKPPMASMSTCFEPLVKHLATGPSFLRMKEDS